MSDDGNFVLRWDLHEKTRTSTLKSLWKNEDFLDVTIACDDDQIDAHKVILSAASPFFQNILKRNPHSHPLIYLRGTAKKDVQSLLRFIYSGETQILQEELEGFMALASSLQVKGLVGEVSGMKEGKYAEPVKKLEENKTKARNEQTIRNKKFVLEEDIPIAVGKYTEFEKATEKLEEKNTESRNKTNVRKKDILLKEDIQIVELTEEMSEMENDISDIMEKYGSSEENESFQYQNTSNTSLTEYDEKISELVAKTENGWTCADCPYASKNKGHVQEHAEKHIEGYSHECKYCEKTFSMKRTLRQHMYKCRKEVSSKSINLAAGN